MKHINIIEYTILLIKSKVVRKLQKSGWGIGAEHEWGHHEGGHHVSFGAGIWMWKHLTEEQQKTLALRRMDTEIEHVESHIRILQVGLEILKSARDMLKSGL
jgi:hypothetical protein